MWTVGVDRRRGGYPVKGAAERSKDVLARYGASIKVDNRETTAGHLTSGLEDKRRALKPQTIYGYAASVTKSSFAAFGALPLVQSPPARSAPPPFGSCRSPLTPTRYDGGFA